MNIKFSSQIKKGTAPVFLIKTPKEIGKCVLFKHLASDNKAYVNNFLKKNGEEESAKVLLLPSGEKAIVILSKENKKNNSRRVILSMRRIITLARREKIKNISVDLEDFLAAGMGRDDAAELMATQFELANFEFNKYKTKPKNGWDFVESAQIHADLTRINAEKVKHAIANGKIIGEEINKARALSNTPGGDMTPAKLAEEARKSGRQAGFKVKILQEAEIKKLGMGGVIGVSRGSAERPRFIIMEYTKGKKGEKPAVLVGKGVTFDTGGLNLKPSSYIYDMHMDMSGGAAVIHTLAALARMKVKKNVVCLVPAVENMPSGSSYHPGDLLKTMNGKTIEVMDTDAEGRVILADALEYSKKYAPALVVDIATLTGAAEVALGQRASAIFSTDEKIENKMREAGERTGDYVWPLPLWEEYVEEVKGTFGDWANVGKSRYGGAITGAVFLWQFIKDEKKEIPWVHLDIAPRMTAIESDSLAKGAAGASINLLIHYLRNN